MPVYESEAIVLQTYPLGEADRLVSFFSRTMGRMRGVASGARKPKSRFGSTLERLSHIRIWYYERENRELVRISQCDMIESFLDAFGDYDSSIALSLFSEITETVLPDREASDANFRLLLLAAQTVKRTGSSELPLAYFALWTVKLGGWLPRLDGCSACGAALGAGDPAYLGRGATAIFCSKCHKGGMRTISTGALAASRRILLERLDRLVDEPANDRIAPSFSREITNAMLDIIEQQIDRKLVSRQLMEPKS
jgi:DNA repair protein RecO (recombination protein O)